MLFPRSRRSMQRYGRNKVIAILVTFAVFWIYVKVFVPQGVVLTKLGWDSGPTAPHKAFEKRWSGVVVAAEGRVEVVLPDSVVAPPETPTGSVLWKRSKIRTVDDHPVVVLYDEADTGGILAAGDEISVAGVFDWTTGGGIIRAFAADSIAFGVTRRD